MRRLLLTIGLSLLLLAPASFATAGEDRLRGVDIEIRGNVVLVEGVYLAVLDLPSGAAADKQTAALVRGQILGFMDRAGYVLASARVVPKDGRLLVDVDEGHVEKIVFIGAGSLRTLQLKLDLNMPHHVLNLRHLEQQLNLMREKYKLGEVTYRLAPAGARGHDRPQVENLGKVVGHSVIPPESRYELHILLGQGTWGTGFSFDLEYDFPDGLTTGAGYKSTGFLFDRDRWKIGSLLGGNLRENLDTKEPYVALSRAFLQFRWYTPPLFGTGLRPYLWLSSNLTSRQRSDLDIENYFSERLDASVNLEFELTRGLSLSAGAGAQELFIFGLDQLADPVEPMDGMNGFRTFARGSLQVDFTTRQARLDKKHKITLSGRRYWSDENLNLTKATFKYQKVFDFGWDDFWVKLRGVKMFDDVIFDDQEPVGGRHLRGVFGTRYYVEQVGSLALEYRFSLTRDLFKVSIFHDAAVFEFAASPDQEELTFANAFGVGVHALALDSFQFDVYYSFGFSSDEQFDYGLAAGFQKVY